ALTARRASRLHLSPQSSSSNRLRRAADGPSSQDAPRASARAPISTDFRDLWQRIRAIDVEAGMPRSMSRSPESGLDRSSPGWHSEFTADRRRNGMPKSTLDEL